MDWVDYLGFLAGTLTTIAFFPQLLIIYRKKSAKDISLGMFIVFCCGVALWLVFGIFRNDPAIIAANAVTLALALAILVLKIRYDSLEIEQQKLRRSSRGPHS